MRRYVQTFDWYCTGNITVIHLCPVHSFVHLCLHIDTVPKPTISCKMNNDSSSNKSGTLECSADYKHSQTRSLLKFEWGSHGNVQPGPQLTISLGHEHDGHEYICNVSNPKSSETTTFTAKDCYPGKISSKCTVLYVMTHTHLRRILLKIYLFFCCNK